MKTLIMSFILLSAPLFVSAEEAQSFQVPVNIKASEADKDSFCHALADQGLEVEKKVEFVSWAVSTSQRFVWRVTRLSSGLVCEKLIEGRYDLQFGPGASKETCRCSGVISVLK